MNRLNREWKLMLRIPQDQNDKTVMQNPDFPFYSDFSLAV